MNPLIDNFTKKLSPCTGCGSMSAAEYFISQQEKGQNMMFIIQVQVEADGVKQAIDNLSSGNVISVNPRPQTVQGAGSGIRTGGPIASPTPQLQPRG